MTRAGVPAVPGWLDSGASGNPGPTVQLQDPGGAVNLEWGPIQPVSQLGSQQLTSGRLAKNADGSVTIWIAPTLPAGAPATNWIPTPSTAYYDGIYGPQNPAMQTKIRPLIRIYYPTPGTPRRRSCRRRTGGCKPPTCSRS